MRINKAETQIKTIGTFTEMLKHVEEVARTCYKSEDNVTELSYEKFVKHLIDLGHEAMIEHAGFSVKFICDRGVSHEVVRHRVASFGQESTRYCNYGKEKFNSEVNYIDLMMGMSLDSKMNKLPMDVIQEIYTVWVEACQYAEASYNKMINLGATPQIARSVLNNSTKTKLWMTGNFREWRHFFKLRCAKAAHPQMREVAIPLLRDLIKECPIIFEDLTELTVI